MTSAVTSADAPLYPRIIAYLRKQTRKSKSLRGSGLVDRIARDLRADRIDITRFPSFPRYVMVAGPSDPVSVILVENPHSFETAVMADAARQAAWICSYGYGLSLKHSRHGEQLAAILANPNTPRTLTRRGNPPSWETLVQHPRLRFWGDLDLEGLAIFERLRSHRPDITLSGLYQPMLEALQRGAGHPYCQATGKPRQRVPEHGGDITKLIDSCRHQAIDQEMVTTTQIAQLWEQPLVLN